MFKLFYCCHDAISLTFQRKPLFTLVSSSSMNLSFTHSFSQSISHGLATVSLVRKFYKIQINVHLFSIFTYYIFLHILKTVYGLYSRYFVSVCLSVYIFAYIIFFITWFANFFRSLWKVWSCCLKKGQTLPFGNCFHKQFFFNCALPLWLNLQWEIKK